MDSFEVRAKDGSVLESSHLVEELRAGSRDMDLFPVLIDEQIGYFHDVDGGFDPTDGSHIVNLIHRVQGPGSPTNKSYDDTMEAHLADHYYHMDVADVARMNEYPDQDFVLSLKVTDYKMGRHSFSEAMSENIDKREQQYSANGEKDR